MARPLTLVGFVLVLASAASADDQAPRRVDFRRDIRPLFQEHCISCHGPAQQMGDLRLDRKSSAMAIRGGTRIGPGNASGSRLYNKLIGTKYGNRMPPTGPLPPEQIELVRNWIDQGAEWPDDLSGDKLPKPADPRAARLMDALRDGDQQAFERLLRQDREAVNLRGEGGATPLMGAALYGDPESLRQLLDAGADPNLTNDSGATALLWALDVPAKTRLLLEHGANANITTESGRSTLAVALATKAPASAIQLLFGHGLKPDVKSKRGNALQNAGGNEPILRLLIEHGIDEKSLASGLPVALFEGCRACVGLLIKSAAKPVLDDSLLSVAGNDSTAVKMLLNAGAEAKYVETGLGFTPLMYASGSEQGSVDDVKMLIEHGADLNASTAEGNTALDFAVLQGRREMIDVLKTAGAHQGRPSGLRPPEPKPAESASAAVRRALPLLQHADVEFLHKAGCVSCHSNNLTAMTVASARRHGVPVNENVAQSQLRGVATYIDANRERYLEGLPIAGGVDTAGYILMGMAAENYSPSPSTDAIARYLKSEQYADGSWHTFGGRPPLESSDIQCTATAMRALRAYGMHTHRAENEIVVQRASDWLAKAQPKTTEDRAFQLLGLAWSGGQPGATRKSASALLAEQRPDGGWAQIPTLASDAYATGEALVALGAANAIIVSDTAYKRGAQFLLSTQLEDGSWFVRSRTIPFQPYFESGFPHGINQFISDAATNWATMALTPLCDRL